jgi:thymidylate synthase ThyX
LKFEAKVVADSISTAGVRLTTLQLRYPRFIHAEFMTHRVFSRNASSSRAIPVAKMIDMVRQAPAMPVHWGKNQAGMQAREELNAPVYLQKALMPLNGYAYGHSEDWAGTDIELTGVIPEDAWRIAAERACQVAEAFMAAGYHKQVVNRILEPFQWMSVIVTATEWDNFFELRDHEDAEPNIQLLARMMKQAMEGSNPILRGCDRLVEASWHLPYVSVEERVIWGNGAGIRTLVKLSAARCARVSFLNHDGSVPDAQKDVELYDRLVGSVPLHASPIEHQAWPMENWNGFNRNPQEVFSGNFRGWNQYRKLVETESLCGTLAGN